MTSSRETASSVIGTIVLIALVFAALYPAAAVAHVAWRIILAGWGAA